MTKTRKFILCFISAVMCVIGASVFASEIPENTLPPLTYNIETSSPLPNSTPTVTMEPTLEPSVTESPQITEEPAEDGIYTNSLDFTVDMMKRKYVIDSVATLEVYNSSGELIGSADKWVGGITEQLSYHFDVPRYKTGEVFTVRLAGGLTSLQYYDTVINPGGTFEVATYAYTDENGQPAIGNSFIFSGEPFYDKEICIYVDHELLDLSPRARLVEGNTMIPIRQVAEAIGLDVYYDPNYDSVVCSVGDKEIIFNAGTTYATFFGETYYTAYPTSYIDGSLYIPARPMAEAFGCTVEALDFGDHLDVVISSSPVVEEYIRNSNPMNKAGISSRTPYLIWVSKPEYKVRVYLGKQYRWELIKTFDCALGAWDTPTITGQFEYIEKLRSWDYPGYYVGPVMRFHNGYALHSTLLYYGGGEYDGRVRVNISHGCVRLHPQDINWLVSYVPLGTKIYITN